MVSFFLVGFSLIRSKCSSIVFFLLMLVGTKVSGEECRSSSQKFSKEVLGEGFNGAVLVAANNKVVFECYYGFANVELEAPITASSKFRIGSLTKSFTSMAILLLESRGELNLNDSLGVYLKGIPEDWKKVTIHQLLTHSSGLMNAWSSPEFQEAVFSPHSLDEVLALLYNESVVFQPGTEYKYSGLGYMILSKVIETVSGASYGDFLNKEIFQPLGMNDTGVDDPVLIVPNRVAGYEKTRSAELFNSRAIYMPALTGAGNLYSTPRDLLRWSRALYSYKLIPMSSYEHMYSEGVEGSNYGYGWSLGSFSGNKTLYHHGVVPGFDSTIVRVPRSQLTAIVISNVRPYNSIKKAEKLLEVHFEFDGKAK